MVSALLGHGLVARAGRDEGHRPRGRFGRLFALDDDGPGGFVVHRLGVVGPDGLVHLRPGAGRQHGALALGETVHDPRHLLNGLALAEDDLREAAPQGPVVVDLGKPEVLERQVAQAVGGLAGREPAGADGLQQFKESTIIHPISLSVRGGPSLAGRHVGPGEAPQPGADRTPATEQV